MAGIEMAMATMMADTSFMAAAGTLKRRGHSHDKAVQAAAEHHADDPAQHGAPTKQSLADDEGSQCDGHHAGADVDADGF